MMLHEDLQYQAAWRRLTALECSDDRWNIKAADLLDRRAREVQDLECKKDVRVSRLERFFDEAASDSAAHFLEAQGEYHRLIGFWRFPSTGGEYLDELIELTKTSRR